MFSSEKQLVIIFLLSLLGIGACEQKPTQEEMKNEVMEIHDYAMAKMGLLHEMEIQVSAATDTTKEEEMKVAASKINALKQASEDMMAWMRQYKTPDELSYEEAKKYFSEQKILIEKVKVDTDKSIEEAKKFIENSK